MAWTPVAVARCVLPVPGPPTRTTLWASSRNSQRWSLSNRVQVRPPFASNNDPSRDAESCCDGLAIYQDENAPPLSRRREGVARLEGRQWRRAEGFPSREAIRRDDSGRRD